MTTYLILIAGCIASAIIFFIIGRKSTNTNTLSNKNKQLEQQILNHTEEIIQITSQRDVAVSNVSMLQESIHNLKAEHQKRLEETLNNHNNHLRQIKLDHDKQIELLKETYNKQLSDRLALIAEQMKTSSETVLKARQDELGKHNREEVSKIIDPLQKSLKDMEQALTLTKEQQRDALARLDETIKLSMAKTISLGETADRLTRALTGEVKVQGNFGELKLKQLLEDLELKEGEQFDTQQTLRNKFGKAMKDDDGKGLIAAFIIHFPDHRHVVVDAKMSLTDYERYMNTDSNTSEKSAFLKAHIDSVRAQVKRLARKDYTRYLPKDCNRLSFAIMYIPIEGAFNLAMLNDPPLWREAYDQGVLILGPHTMYMNLRVLEMMWRQVRQLKNQQTMIDAADTVIERVQDFALRFSDVESSLNDTVKKMNSFKITTSDSGRSIITAARQLIKAGAHENKKKKSLNDTTEALFGENILPEE